MNGMIIERGGVEYYCKWESCGWSYAEAHIYVPTKLLGFIPWYKHVYETSKGLFWGATLYNEAKHAHKDEIVRWYNRALDSYLKRKASWEE